MQTSKDDCLVEALQTDSDILTHRHWQAKKREKYLSQYLPHSPNASKGDQDKQQLETSKRARKEMCSRTNTLRTFSVGSKC